MLKFLLPAFLAISTANATIVFSNYTGTGCGCGVTVKGSAVTAGPLSDAEEFTPSANYLLTDVVLFMGNPGSSSGNDGNFNVSIFTNSSGLPGTLIEQIGSNLPTTVAEGPVTANSIGTPTSLNKGTSYWVVLTPFDTQSAPYWDENGSSFPPGAQSPTANGSSGWTSTGGLSAQMQIDGTLIPEPASLVAIASGLLLLGSLRLLRRAEKFAR